MTGRMAVQCSSDLLFMFLSCHYFVVVTSGEKVIDAGGDAAAVECRDVINSDAVAINDTYIDTLNLWVAPPLCILGLAFTLLGAIAMHCAHYSSNHL